MFSIRARTGGTGVRCASSPGGSEVAAEDEPILLRVIVTLQVLPSCLPVNLYESGEIYAPAVFGELLGELCPAHLTLIGFGEILQHPGAEVLNKRFDRVGAVVLQQFLEGFQFFRILVFCEQFFLLLRCGGDATRFHDRFVEGSEGGFAILANVTATQALLRPRCGFHGADGVQQFSSFEHFGLVCLVCGHCKGSGGRITSAFGPVCESSPGEVLRGSHPKGKDFKLITAAHRYGFHGAALPFDLYVTGQQWQLNSSGCGAVEPGVDDHAWFVCCEYPTMETASVAVGDVPGSERSLRAGVIPLGEPLAAQFTLALLLLQHLESDGREAGIRCKDAVGIEFGFVHTVKVGWIEQKVKGETLRESGDRHSAEHDVGNGSHAIYPFPLGDLLSGRNGTIHVVLPLHRNGVVLTLMVGSNVIHLNGRTGERGPGAAHVEGSFGNVCFVHTSMMAQIPGFGSSS